MRNTLSMSVAVAVAGLLAAACSESNTTALSDQAQVAAAVQDQLGTMMTDSGFGDAGVVGTFALAGYAGATFASPALDTVAPPRFWGRLRVVPGGPKPVINKDITIIGDSAWVSLTVHFDGIFLVDTSADSTFNPTSKPLVEYFTQKAVLVRDATAMHGWRPVLLSPHDWKPTATDRQTVAVTDVKVYRNDTLLVDVTNPDSLYDYVRHVPVFHVGDSVKVVAAVTNTTGGAYFPPTFVYLHVRHVDPTALVWRRIRMQDNGDGTYTRTWVAHTTGRDRFAVDALDAATLELGSTDNYRANVVGIPFRIE